MQRRRLHLGSGQQITEDREQLGQAGANVLFQLEVDQLVGARVGQVDAKLAVEADHPPRDTGEHSLGEATAQVGFVGGPQQLELLRLDLVGHAVEGVGQGCQLIPCSVVRDRHPGGQVARTQPVRRPRQLQQRRRQPQREPQPRHPGNDHQQQRDHEEQQAENQPVLLGRASEVGVARCRFLGLFHPGDDFLKHRDRGEQVGLGEIGRIQRDQDRQIVRTGQGNIDPALGQLGAGFPVDGFRADFLRQIEERLRDAAQILIRSETGSDQHLTVGLNDVGTGKAAQADGLVEQLLQVVGIAGAGAEVFDPLCDAGGLIVEALAVFFEVGQCHVARAVDGIAHGAAEPGLNAKAQHQHRHQRDHQRRQARHDDQEQHHAPVDLRAREPGANVSPGVVALYGDEGPECDQNHHVEPQQRHDPAQRPGRGETTPELEPGPRQHQQRDHRQRPDKQRQRAVTANANNRAVGLIRVRTVVGAKVYFW